MMIEKHYSGAIHDLLDDVVASAIVPLAPIVGHKVVPPRAGQQFVRQADANGRLLQHWKRKRLD